MVSFRNLQDEARSTVLNFLKSVDKVLGTATEKRVTVVQSGHDKGYDKLLCSCYRKIEMRRYRKIPHISYKDHVTNKEVCAKIQ